MRLCTPAIGREERRCQPVCRTSRTWLSEADCDLDDFRSLVEQVTHPRDYPLADSVDRNVPLVSDGDRLRRSAANPERRREVRPSWSRRSATVPWHRGVQARLRRPGGVDRNPPDVFNALIADQRAAGATGR